MKSLPALLLLSLLSLPCTVHAEGMGNWLDSVSLSYGKDDQSNSLEVYRIGLQNQWERSWLKEGAWYLSGYWDAELAWMTTDHGGGAELANMSITPVLRLQRDAELSSGVTPYAEGGIGLHLLSESRIASQDLGSHAQFGSLFGFGLALGGKGNYELGYRFQHISNADIKKPNDGLDLHMLRLGYNIDW